MKSLIPILLFIFYAGILQTNAQCPNNNGDINTLPVCGVYGNSSGVSNWNWEDVNKNTFCNNWYARIDGKPGLTPMGSPFVDPSIDALKDIRNGNDFLRSKGWELLRRDFGCSRATTYPYFVLYNRYSGLLRVFVYMPTGSETYTGIAVEISPDLGSSYPATTAFTDTIQTAPNKFRDNSPGNFGRNMVAIGELAGLSRWSLAEFRPSFDPFIEHPNYQDASLNFKVYGVTTNQMFANIRGGSVTSTKPIYNFSYNSQQPLPNSQGGFDWKAVGERLTQFTSQANTYREELNKIASNVTDFIGGDTSRKSILKVYHVFDAIKTATATAAAFDKAIKITQVVKAVSGVIGIVSTIAGIISSVSGNGGSGPSYTSYDMVLNGTISTKQMLTSFIIQVPGTPQSDPQSNSSNLPYYKCPLGLFNIKYTPQADVITYDRTDRYSHETGSTFPDQPVFRKYQSYRLKNDLEVSFNDKAGLDLVSVQAAFIGEVQPKADGTASYDLFEEHNSSGFLGMGKFYRGTINHMLADFDINRILIKRFDTQKKLHIFQSPFTDPGCLNGLSFNVPSTTKVYLQVKAILKKENDPSETPILFIQNYAIETTEQTIDDGLKYDLKYKPKTTLPPYCNYTVPPLYRSDAVVTGGLSNISPNGFIEADNNVSTLGNVNVTPTSGETYYVAGTDVILTDGFEAQPGSEFGAWTSNFGYSLTCSSNQPEPFTIPGDCFNSFLTALRVQTEPAKELSTNKETTISVFPVPAGNNIYVSGLNSINKPVISIIDQSGRTIRKIQRYSFNAAGSVSLDVSGLSNGVYFISIQTTNSTVTKKIVISK